MRKGLRQLLTAVIAAAILLASAAACGPVEKVRRVADAPTEIEQIKEELGDVQSKLEGLEAAVGVNAAVDQQQGEKIEAIIEEIGSIRSKIAMLENSGQATAEDLEELKQDMASLKETINLLASSPGPDQTAQEQPSPSTPTPVPGRPGWTNLHQEGQVWLSPPGTVHIETVYLDDQTERATSAKIRLINGKAMFAIMAVGAEFKGCAVYHGTAGNPKLSCPTQVLGLEMETAGPDGTTLVVSTPSFGGDRLPFGEVAQLLGQPFPGFALVWEVGTESPFTGLMAVP